MQITFLTTYYTSEDPDYKIVSKMEAQDDLLYSWRRALQNNQITFIPKAQITFKDYDFFEYPDQEKSRRFIQKSYGLYDRKIEPLQYFWACNYYSDLDTLYETMAKQKRFMELAITVEEE